MVVIKTEFDVCGHDIQKSDDTGKPYVSIDFTFLNDGFSSSITLDSNVDWVSLYSNPEIEFESDNGPIMRKNGNFYFSTSNAEEIENDWTIPSITAHFYIPESTMLPEIEKIINFIESHRIPDGEKHCDQCAKERIEYEEYMANLNRIDQCEVPCK